MDGLKSLVNNFLNNLCKEFNYKRITFNDEIMLQSIQRLDLNCEYFLGINVSEAYERGSPNTRRFIEDSIKKIQSQYTSLQQVSSSKLSLPNLISECLILARESRLDKKIESSYKSQSSENISTRLLCITKEVVNSHEFENFVRSLEEKISKLDIKDIIVPLLLRDNGDIHKLIQLGSQLGLQQQKDEK